MLKYIKSLIWDVGPKDDPLKSAYNVLDEAYKEEENLENTEDEIEEESKYNCEHRIGFITNINDFKYEIDNKYEFTSEKLFAVGTKVSFTTFRDNGNFKVTEVKEIVDEWGIIEHNDTRGTWCMRNIITEVQKRQQRIIFTTDKITIDLNQVTSSFIPVEGDVIQLDAKYELLQNAVNCKGKILEIVKISPIRIKIISGVIRSYDHKTATGTVNRDCFFVKESLTHNYIPKVGDKVTAEIIENNHDRYSWRCLKIVPNKMHDPTNLNQFEALPQILTYQHDLEGLTISNNVTLYPKDFKDLQTFSISVRNERTTDVLLKNVTFEAPMKQTKLICPKMTRLSLEKNSCTEFTFEVHPKSYGKSQETILFHFADAVVAKMVYIIMDTKADQTSNYKSNSKIENQAKFESMRKEMLDEAKVPIRGRSIKPAPRFIAKRRNDWHIPGYLMKIFYKHSDYETYKSNVTEDLERLKPCLLNPNCVDTYEDRFHTLLYVEELYTMMLMRKFDQDRASFIQDSPFLILEVDNLAESRPSIIIGDKVIATCLSTSIPYEGVVHKVTGSHVFLKFTELFHDLYKGEDYKIHVVPSRTNFRKLHQGVLYAKANISQVLFPSHILKKSIQVHFTYEPYEDTLKVVSKGYEKDEDEEDENDGECNVEHAIKPVTKGRTAEHHNLRPAETKQNAKLVNGMNGLESKLVKKTFQLEWFNPELNFYQKEAVRNILLGESRPLPYVIFGPPGTGKTVTIVECILQLLRMIPHSRQLVSAPSNSAANILTTRLIEYGSVKPGDLVRLVSYKSLMDQSVPSNILPYCAFVSIAKEGTIESENEVAEAGYVNNMTVTNLIRHRIIIGTCMTLGALQQVNIKQGHITHVIVDEAGQCSEPELMIPVSLVDPEGQIILAGDPMQLGPIAMSREAKYFGYCESYLERLTGRFPYARDIQGFPETGGFHPKLLTKLLYNYRSLPELLQIPNSLFYNRDLRATISETDSEEMNYLQKFESILPKTKQGRTPALVFHGVEGVNQRADDSPSWYNKNEIAQVFYYVNELYRLGATKQEIGIVSPYIKQVRQIRQILAEADFDMPRVGTVEEFQGLEYKVIIVSTVRSHSDLLANDSKHSLGFISNPRRFNVVMTRSRCLTIIIGNPYILSSDYYWGLVLAYCRKIGSYVGCEMQRHIKNARC